MSELLSAAAGALGIPEALVSRSAAARAAEAGVTANDILSAWAGGGPAPAPTPAAEPEEVTEEAAPVSTEPEPAPEPEAMPTAPVAPSAPVPAAPIAPVRPPVLVGADDNPLAVFAGVLGLFLVVLLVGLVGPSTPVDPPGERTGAITFSPSAEAGRTVYMSEGCAFCHTQMVRPVIADVGLGGATLNDSNQVIGIRRFGPDLANVGGRLDAGQISAIIGGSGGHPVSGLSGDELSALAAYLSEGR